MRDLKRANYLLTSGTCKKKKQKKPTNIQCDWTSSLTLYMSHPVWMRVVAGEERVVAQGAETRAAWGQLLGELGAEC